MVDDNYILGDTIFCNIPEGIEVKKNNNLQYSLYSTKNFCKGDILGSSVCFILPINYNINKIQITDCNNFINVYQYNEYNSSINEKKNIKKCWSFDCFMNHSCLPNVSEIDDTTVLDKGSYLIERFKIIATNDIKIGDEIVTNYLKFEYVWAFPFECNCKNSNCFKTIRGFKYLSPEQKQKLLPEINEKIINEFNTEELNYNN